MTRTRRIPHRLLPFLLMSGAAMLAACSTSSDKVAQPSVLPVVASPIAITRNWYVDLGASAGTFLRPCVLENAIYAASGSGTLARIDPSNGAQVWKVSVPGGIAAGVGSDGSIAAVVGPRGDVIAFDAAGKRVWDARASSNATTPPLVGHGLVIVLSTDNHVIAFDAVTGKRRWIFEKQQPSLALRTETEMIFSGDSLLVGFPGGRLVSISLANGAGRWDAGVSEPKGATEVERLADVLGVPGLEDHDVCTGSYQGRVACFDASSGDLRWAREFSSGTGIVVSADAVYAVDASSHVSRMARTNGATLWNTGILANRKLGAPVLIGKTLALGDFEGRIHFLSIEDGTPVGRFDASGGSVISTPQVWNQSVILQTAQGLVLRLTPAGG